MARRKLNTEILSLREASVKGVFVGTRQLLTADGEPVTSKKFGNELHVLEMRDPTSGDLFTYWADAGLRGSIKMAKVQPNMVLQIVHTGQKEIEQGTVQTYDIFDVADEFPNAAKAIKSA